MTESLDLLREAASPVLIELPDQFRKSVLTFPEPSMKSRSLWSGRDSMREITRYRSPEERVLGVLQEISANIKERLPEPNPQPKRRPSTLSPLRSGAQGRPTSMHLIRPELERRIASGQLEKTCVAQTEALAEWFKIQYPDAAPATPKAIRNSLGSLYRLGRAQLHSRSSGGVVNRH